MKTWLSGEFDVFHLREPENSIISAARRDAVGKYLDF